MKSSQADDVLTHDAAKGNVTSEHHPQWFDLFMDRHAPILNRMRRMAINLPVAIVMPTIMVSDVLDHSTSTSPQDSADYGTLSAPGNRTDRRTTRTADECPFRFAVVVIIVTVVTVMPVL